MSTTTTSSTDFKPTLDVKDFCATLEYAATKQTPLGIFSEIFQFSYHFVESLAQNDIAKLPAQACPILLNIIQTYHKLLDKTGIYVAQVLGTCYEFKSTTQKILSSKKLVATDPDLAIKRLASLQNVEMKFDHSQLNQLIKEWSDFNNKLATAKDEIEKLGKEYKFKRWAFIGIAAVSGALLIGSAIVIGCATAGVGIFAVAAGAAAAAVVAGEAAVAAGTIAGIVGAVISAALLSGSIAASAIYAQLEERAKQVANILDQMYETSKTVEHTQLANLRNCIAKFQAANQSQNEDITYLKDCKAQLTDALNEVSEEQLNKHFGVCQQLQEEANELESRLEEAREHLKKLVDVEHRLSTLCNDYKRRGCVQPQ